MAVGKDAVKARLAKWVLVVIPSVVVFFCGSSCSFSEPIDSLRNENTFSTIDPVRNRLFWMSTGQTMPQKKFSVGSYEVFLAQAGYGATEFLQFNFSWVLPIFGTSDTYWSVGTKLRLLPASGFFQGVAAGADFGFFSRIFDISSTSPSEHLTSVNIAGSVGTEVFKCHVSVAQLQFSSTQSEVPIPTFVQVGTELQLSRNPEGGGVKFVAETLFPRTHQDLELSTVVLGLRFFGPGSAGEFAWPLSRIGFNGTQYDLKPWGIPYFSVTLLF